MSTRSFKALQLYARALPDLFLLADPKAAEQLLLGAIKEDPDFAVAYAALARALFEQRLNLDDAQVRLRDGILDHLDRAVALSDRASVEDRYVVTIESESLRSALSGAS